MWPEILRGGIVPFGVAAVAWASLTRPWRRTGGPAAGLAACGALAIGLGILGGYVALYGMPTWPIREHWRRMAIVIVAATAVTGLMSWRRLTRGVDALVGGITAGGLAWLIVPGFVEPEESLTRWRLMVGATLAASWCILRLPGKHDVSRPLAPMIGLVIAAVATAGVLMQAGNARLAQLAGAMGAAAGALAVAAMWRPAFVSPWSVLPAAVLPLASLAFLGKFYDSAGVPAAAFALVAAAPVAIAMPDLLPQGLAHRWRAALRIGTVLILAGAAVALTMGRAAVEEPYY